MTKSILAVCALGATALSTHAASIGLNFGAGRANASLAAGDSAGVVPQTNWNNLNGAGGGPTVLNGDNGVASGASVIWASDEQWSIGGPAADANGTLLNGWISENTTPGGSSPIDISGIPYANYDLIFYLNHDRAAEDVVLNEANGAFSDFTAIENDTDILSPVTFVQQTTSGVGSGNYVIFSGLTASTLNINLQDATGGSAERNPITGIQIVESAPIPEASSSLMALLAVIGFVARRRR